MKQIEQLHKVTVSRAVARAVNRTMPQWQRPLYVMSFNGELL
jgi:hypothetical protein